MNHRCGVWDTNVCNLELSYSRMMAMMYTPTECIEAISHVKALVYAYLLKRVLDKPSCLHLLTVASGGSSAHGTGLLRHPIICGANYTMLRVESWLSLISAPLAWAINATDVFASAVICTVNAVDLRTCREINSTLLVTYIPVQRISFHIRIRAVNSTCTCEVMASWASI